MNEVLLDWIRSHHRIRSMKVVDGNVHLLLFPYLVGIRLCGDHVLVDNKTIPYADPKCFDKLEERIDYLLRHRNFCMYKLDDNGNKVYADE